MKETKKILDESVQMKQMSHLQRREDFLVMAEEEEGKRDHKDCLDKQLPGMKVSLDEKSET